MNIFQNTALHTDKKTACWLLLAFFSMAFSVNLAAATLTSQVDRTAFPANETVVLTVSYDEDPDGIEIDHTLLQQDFNIVSSNKTSSIEIINGNASRKTDWIFELAPRKKGILLIPSFSINNHFSEAITIKATDAAKNSVNGGQKIYSEVDIDKHQVHVQEQLIMTWRLVSTLTISDPVMNTPQIDNVLVQDLGSRQYQRSGSDGNIEVVLEQRYAFFPQKSGEVVVPAQQFQFLMNTTRRFHTGLIHNSQERRLIRTAAQTITVLPAKLSNTVSATANTPVSNTNQQWLPAMALSIEQQLTDLNALGQATVGEPFTRTITMRASGLMAEQLPASATDIQSFKTYSDKPEFKNDNDDKGVVSTHVERVTMIPAQEGTFTLPAIQIPWYNTASKQWETAQLPAKDIVVAPGKSANIQPAKEEPATPTGLPTLTDDDASSDHINKNEQPAGNAFYKQISPVTLGVIALLIIALLFLAIKIVLMQRKMHVLLTTGALPTTNTVIPPAKANSNVLMASAESGDLSAFYKALLQWSRQHWSANPPHTLADIADRVNDSQLHAQLMALDACLYGSNTPPPSLSNIALAIQKASSDNTSVIAEKPQLDELY